MKIGNLKCIDYKVVGDTLTAIVEASINEAKTALIGQETICVTTDNEEISETVEELIGFVKGKSVSQDLEKGLVTIVIERKTDLEKRLEAVEAFMKSGTKSGTSKKTNSSLN